MLYGCFDASFALARYWEGGSAVAFSEVLGKFAGIVVPGVLGDFRNGSETAHQLHRRPLQTVFLPPETYPRTG